MIWLVPAAVSYKKRTVPLSDLSKLCARKACYEQRVCKSKSALESEDTSPADMGLLVCNCAYPCCALIKFHAFRFTPKSSSSCQSSL